MALDSFDPLKIHFQKKADLVSDEMNQLLSCFREKKVKKKQVIIQPEHVAKYRSYILKGGLRAYVIDKKGHEQTIQFAVEDWWISDYNSYIYQQPAAMYVEAFEESIILQIDYEAEKKLKESNHKFETIFRITAEKGVAFQQRRIISAFTQNAKERFAEFQEKYPAIVNRLPQYALASYLGMTTEFLSKIRNNRLKK